MEDIGSPNKITVDRKNNILSIRICGETLLDLGINKKDLLAAGFIRDPITRDYILKFYNS